jgi:hypothetical protein
MLVAGGASVVLVAGGASMIPAARAHSPGHISHFWPAWSTTHVSGVSWVKQISQNVPKWGWLMAIPAIVGTGMTVPVNAKP